MFSLYLYVIKAFKGGQEGTRRAWGQVSKGGQEGRRADKVTHYGSTFVYTVIKIPFLLSLFKEEVFKW